MTIPRTLEPEVMDTEQDAVEYDAMDFTEANTAFAERALELLPKGGRILDLGTGTARIPLLMAELGRAVDFRIDAVDLSAEMLKVGQVNVDKAGFTDRIRLMHADVKKLPCDDHSYDFVISNSLVHHIPSPAEVFLEIERVVRPGGAILLRDLFRPDEMETLEELVVRYTEGASSYQRKLFRDSLHASLTIPEVEALASDAGLVNVTVTAVSDRHWSLERPASVI